MTQVYSGYLIMHLKVNISGVDQVRLPHTRPCVRARVDVCVPARRACFRGAIHRRGSRKEDIIIIIMWRRSPHVGQTRRRHRVVGSIVRHRRSR